ncbi:MAG: tRNA lysidine(34) synthetase TilS [Pyrinomonadaceae bacterium]|nr:tRNA lysidine(34) synthetase TilS [Pyrinomonadaceae bacterium]
MPGFVKKFLSEWRRLGVKSSSTLIAGVSGGADSCALLYALSELRANEKIGNRIIAAHFDHALRGEDSAQDLVFVSGFAASLGVEFRTAAANPDDYSGNLEQDARRARYRFLESVALSEKADAVLTGHTQNDQAETVLINMIRGSGPSGVSGMPVRRRLSGSCEIELLRPMLLWATRADTERYCVESHINFRDDDMNEDPSFSRVRIRKSLIPILKDLNPNIILTLARSAENAVEAQDALDWFAVQNEQISNIVESEEIAVAELNDLPPSIRNLAVRKWLETRLGTLKRISRANTIAVIDLAGSRKSGRIVEIPGEYVVLKHEGKLKLTNKHS